MDCRDCKSTFPGWRALTWKGTTVCPSCGVALVRTLASPTTLVLVAAFSAFWITQRPPAFLLFVAAFVFDAVTKDVLPARRTR